MKVKAIFPVVVKRTEERNALNVIPMKMGDENVGGNRGSIEFVAQRLPQNPEAGATIKYVKLIANAHFHAGSVAAVAHIFRLRSGRRPPNSPELNPHMSPRWMLAKLPSSASWSNPSIHSLVTAGYASGCTPDL